MFLIQYELFVCLFWEGLFVLFFFIQSQIKNTYMLKRLKFLNIIRKGITIWKYFYLSHHF